LSLPAHVLWFTSGIAVIVLCGRCVLEDNNVDKFQIPELKGKSYNWRVETTGRVQPIQYHDFKGGKIKEPYPLPNDASNQQK